MNTTDLAGTFDQAYNSGQLPQLAGDISATPKYDPYATSNYDPFSKQFRTPLQEWWEANNGVLREKNNFLARQEASLDREWQSQSAQKAMDFEAEQNRLNREFQQESADKSMQFEKQEAEIQRKWLEEMSNSAYTRAVADMKNAGINPMLMVSKGFSGASTPSTGMPSGAQGGGSSASGFASRGSKASLDKASYIVSTFNSLMNSASGVAKSAFMALS